MKTACKPHKKAGKPLVNHNRKRGKTMSIKDAKIALDRAIEAYYNAIRDSIINTLAKSLNSIDLKIDDTMTMTYKKNDILTEEEQETAFEAELTAYDKAFDEVDEAFERAAEAVYIMLRKADIDEWCKVETHHYYNNVLGLEIRFGGIEYFFTIEHRN